MLSGCIGMPASRLREQPVLATWMVPTAPEKTATCIARDVANRFGGTATARVHPGYTQGVYEVFLYSEVGLLVDSPALRGLYVVSPDGAGSKITFQRDQFVDTEARAAYIAGMASFGIKPTMGYSDALINFRKQAGFAGG
jgi:hypothetical protein